MIDSPSLHSQHHWVAFWVLVAVVSWGIVFFFGRLRYVGGKEKPDRLSQPHEGAKREKVIHSTGPEIKYEAQPLLSVWEHKTYQKIQAALPPNGEIVCFAQVRYADFMGASDKHSPDEQFEANRQIFGKSADFVFYDKRRRGVVLVYELNDSTHNRPDRKRRDILISGALKSANIPLIVIKPYEERDVVRDLRWAKGQSQYKV
ncbi:DUF2726 domain-containing protein [Acetobacter pasteurianus]|uniref:DUF2726 domain-containing protein n=1 Tax=Acetobacter pasteurianus NBRC 3188 TaxID=1226663 RepID=A0A401WY53_ACEPA|nr:DUF2726 domain-containing protein [Acetobacter pasteurianus]GCD54234.1 hypothetical protein NBRC3188_2931 [Acetobacter pasteurianus NBRC 3188]